jgi:hypothetical protein
LTLQTGRNQQICLVSFFSEKLHLKLHIQINQVREHQNHAVTMSNSLKFVKNQEAKVKTGRSTLCFHINF